MVCMAWSAIRKCWLRAGTLDPAEACKELVRMAKERGGFDNITLQILKIS